MEKSLGKNETSTEIILKDALHKTISSTGIPCSCINKASDLGAGKCKECFHQQMRHLESGGCLFRTRVNNK